MRKSVYTRPAKSKFAFRPGKVEVPDLDKIEVKAPVVVHASTECHVTPEHIADLMVSYLNPSAEASILEPSAGTGNLIQALLDAGYLPGNITIVEQNYELYHSCGERFDWKLDASNHTDFLEWASLNQELGQGWDYILMNPPFRKVRAHMKAAVSLLASMGELVAIVPVTFEAEGFTELERLPVDTFSACKVNTKIVHYIKD